MKRRVFSTNTNITFKSPDLLAINSLGNSYGVFESKGYSQYSSKAMEKGYVQAKSIKKVNGKSPKNRLVVMTQIDTKEIKMIEKDPKGESCEISVDSDFLHLYHFLPIVELIAELNAEEREDWIYGSLIHRDDCYSIGIPLDLYKELLPITKIEQQSIFDKVMFETNLREKYLPHLEEQKSKKRILCVE